MCVYLSFILFGVPSFHELIDLLPDVRKRSNLTFHAHKDAFSNCDGQGFLGILCRASVLCDAAVRAGQEARTTKRASRDCFSPTIQRQLIQLDSPQ